MQSTPSPKGIKYGVPFWVYLIVQSTPSPKGIKCGVPCGYPLSCGARPPEGYGTRDALLGILYRAKHAHPKGIKCGVPCGYELFSTISVALLKCVPPIVVNNFRKVTPFDSYHFMFFVFSLIVTYSFRLIGNSLENRRNICWRRSLLIKGVVLR